jgi:ATP-binding cassette subfamily B protein RaxB
MLLYSPVLALIVLSTVVLYLIIRTSSIHIQRRFAGDTIVAQAAEQTRFLESVRAIETIKAAGVETMREGQQRNAIAASINAVIRSGNITIGFSGAAALLDGAAEIAIIYLGARAIIAGHMTVGMLGAFLAYKMQFGTRMTNLVEQFITWRMLSVDLERLSDIALAKTERQVAGGFDGELVGDIECRALSFSYGFGEVPVLRQIGVKIAPGDYVAIIGPSGGGKSTLLKLLVGLYSPVAGQVLIDGRPLGDWNAKHLRSQIALVSQEDSLLAGSVAENIALFDEAIDMEQVRSCAKVAHIHNEIVQMPMGYETLVGDMGSSLSGGQKQRLLIARALYRRPRILILDEGTSHLDIFAERAVNEALSGLNITRIVVAHRPETIRAASKHFMLQDGRLFELSSNAVDQANSPPSEGAVPDHPIV